MVHNAALKDVTVTLYVSGAYRVINLSMAINVQNRRFPRENVIMKTILTLHQYTHCELSRCNQVLDMKM